METCAWIMLFGTVVGLFHPDYEDSEMGWLIASLAFASWSILLSAKLGSLFIKAMLYY